jgi:iron complex outermembrane recepter protein
MRSGLYSISLKASASLLATAAYMTFSAGTAHSQTTSQGANQVETVVVTAERRSTDVQTTPIAVSVLSADDLAKKSVRTIEQLMFATPALTFNNFGQGDIFNIRGLGKGENNVQTPSGVTTYINGVPIAGGFFQDFPFFDEASVEVLRGPQGTFAGENATGGAIFITTARPNFDGYNGYGQIQGGNYADVQLQGAVNIPVTDDFAIRIGGFGERRDSFWTVTPDNRNDPGNLQEGAGRIEFLWQPTTAFSAYFYNEYDYINQNGYPNDPATTACVTVPAPSCTRNTSDPFKIQSDVNEQGIQYGYRSSLDLRYTFEGGIALRSISSYTAGGGAERADLDGTAIPAYAGYLFHDHGEEKIFSQEINLLSPTNGPLTWVVGAFFQHDHVDLPPGNGFDIGVPAGTVDVVLSYHTPKQHEAVFGQVTYDVTPALQLQFGLRYNHSTFDLKDQQQTLFLSTIPLANYNAPCPVGVVPPNCSNDTHQSDSALTGKFDVSYKLDQDDYLYAFVATGHKDGGLNTTPELTPFELPFIKPERVIDYETGWKASFFNEHLRTTLDGFYDNYTDFQVSITAPNGNTGVLNAPKATLYGIEAQGDAVFDALSFDFAGAYIHGTYGSDMAGDSRFGDVVNIGGNQMVNSPHWTFNVGVQYAFSLDNGDTLTPRIDYAFVDTQTTSIFDVPGLDQLGVRNILNAQLTYAMQNNWSIAAYATNLADQHYIAAFSAGLGILPGTSSNLRDAGAPRQFGLRITKAF